MSKSNLADCVKTHNERQQTLDYLAGRNITHVAKHIGVSLTTLSRVLNCLGGVSVEMSLRLDPYARLYATPSTFA
jgi:uncharacterized protein YerC